MKVLEVESALHILLESCLQIGAVFFMWSSFLFFGILGLMLFLLLLFTPLFFVPVLYSIFYYCDRNKHNEGGRPSKWVREWKVWHYFRDYFPIKMIKTADLDPKRNYILGYHPHGIMCFGAHCCFASEATDFSFMYPGIVPYTLTLEGNFRFPFFRDYWMGRGFCAVSKESIEYLLTKNGTGNAVVIVVGGAAESLEARPGAVTLVLRKRKGFVRLALKYGASLVPVFAFGENDLFSQVSNPEGTLLRALQNKLKGFFRFAVPLAYGRGIFENSFGFLPYRCPVNVIAGAPIDLEKIPEPTEEDIESTLQLYIQKLTELFERHKDKYARDVQLNII